MSKTRVQKPGSFWSRVTINGEGDPRFPDGFDELPAFPGNLKPGEIAEAKSEFEYKMTHPGGDNLSIRVGVTLPCAVDEIHYAIKAAVDFNKRQIENIVAGFNGGDEEDATQNNKYDSGYDVGIDSRPGSDLGMRGSSRAQDSPDLSEDPF